MCSLEREEATDLIKRYGGRVTGSISKKTVCILVGHLFYETIVALYIFNNLRRMLVHRATYWLTKTLVELNLTKQKIWGITYYFHKTICCIFVLFFVIFICAYIYLQCPILD